MTSTISQQEMVPVNLSEEQINNILSEIPNPPGIGKRALSLARKHIVERVRAILETVKIYPLPDAFQEYKDEILKSLYESYVEPGTAVGVTAGVSIGAPVTQLSLNSFHFAGAQSGVALAFQKVRDSLTGSKMNRTPQMKIFFKEPFIGSDLHDILHVGTFDSILAMRSEFEQTTLEDIALNTSILSKDEAINAGVSEMITLHSQLRPERFIDVSTRYPLTYVVEINLNTYRMYTHRLTMSMVAQAIEGPAPPDALTCVWRSQLDGRIYILVDETKNYGQQAMDQSMAILMMLQRDIIRKFSQFKINGITGILALEPQEIRVIRGIYRVKSSVQTPGTHYVYTNNRRTRWDGISLADIHRLINVAGFKIRPIGPKNKESLYLTVDEYNGDFMKELEKRINDALDKPSVERNDSEQKIAAAAIFYYGQTNGTNLEELIWRDDIDLFRTVSNHSHEILDLLGIDAARIFLILRFMQTLQDFSSYINTRHISLIFDLLCNLGIINSLSFVGINRRKIGPLAMASYERSLDVFVNSSVFGDKEAIVGVSPAIYVGQKSKRVGTGSISIEEDLTITPADRPTMPTIDENTIIDDSMIDEDLTSGESLIDLLANERVMQDQKFTEITTQSVPIDKTAIQNTTKITSEIRPVTESIEPVSAQMLTASETLINALQKVTIGTELIIEPDKIPQRSDQLEVITVTDISNPQRAQPERPPVVIDILSSLQSVSGTVANASIEVPIPERIGVPIPERIGETELAIAPPILTKTTREPTYVPQELSGSSPSSFVSQLPDLSEITVQPSVRGSVQNISMTNFASLYSQYKQ